ncbi:class I SAM-dependent methyltransferase [uncultured Cohaesibacter sp.]|uniref:class I SAM-dependent methyltransferase n=1 Tax=uncultured Cohaesibacter sp. TaxID=1002546 RepID=UPI0029C984F8|nr:class I SAM-dependent methyltransferase [uncultured Cohaesibacter sp.]
MVETDSPSLEALIKRLILATGPVSVATYMSLCLTDPQHGFYTSQRPIGAKGDFITAPEISQLFGELIGIWMLAVWQQSGRPAPFHLVELGPGRGTLASDMIRAIATDPEAMACLHLHLLEISPTLQKQQQTALSDIDYQKSWHSHFASLPQAPLFIIGNEFFDCLPIHQWIFHKDQWHERVIGLNAEEQLAFGLGPIRAAPELPESPEQGAILEHSPACEAMMSTIAAHLATHGGAGLFIDYGYDTPGFGDTFQAMRHHAYADPLLAPGQQDLTAHVNFESLRRQAQAEILGATNTNHPSAPLTLSPIVTQGEFLLAMGLLQRAGQLGAHQPAHRQEQISQAVERLAGPDQMGKLFKCLALMPALMPDSLPLPPASLT